MKRDFLFLCFLICGSLLSVIAEASESLTDVKSKDSHLPDINLKNNWGLAYASQVAPGLCLTPPEYIQFDAKNDEFNLVMGREAERVSGLLRRKAVITKESLEKILAQIAKVRKKLNCRSFLLGYPTPRTFGGALEYVIESPAYVGEYDVSFWSYVGSLFNGSGCIIDWVHKDEEPHTFYFTDLNDMWGKYESRPWATYQAAENKQIKLSHIVKGAENREGEFGVVHPNFENQGLILEKVMERFANALDELNLSSDESESTLDVIADSIRLLCHATPYLNGSPSILLTYLDGFFRSRGFAMRLKKKEFFWHAILWEDKSGPYTWKHFMSNFKVVEVGEDSQLCKQGTSAGGSCLIL